MFYYNIETNTGIDIVNLFKQHFSTVYKLNNLTNYKVNSNYNIFENSLLSISSINIPLMEVFNELWSLKTNYSTGLDNILPKFLKETAFILSPIITFLFNKSIQTGSFPNTWKYSLISPIFKKGEKSQVTNYRLISKISIIHKIFSKLVNKTIFLLCDHIIINEKHGFRPKRSTITNLCIFKQSILDSLVDKAQIDVIYTDFEKAFNRVNHSLLIYKLKLYGFREPLLLWFNSFLSNRSQVDKYENDISNLIHVLSGVPQGDYLTPLLSLFFINDMNKVLNYSNCLLFADDTKIFKKIKCIDDSLKLQADLDNFYKWGINNEMSFNIDKFSVISCSLKKKHYLFLIMFYIIPI
jgi:hypothetical protein